MLGPNENPKTVKPLICINKSRTKKPDQKGCLVRGLVRLVQLGPNRTKTLQPYENKPEKADQIWTKFGPRTVLDRHPRPFRAGGWSVGDLKGWTK